MLFNRVVVAAGLALAACAQAAPVQWAGNGHWYEFVDTLSTWDEASTAAAGMSHLGRAGHLATVTSQGEQDFILASVTGATSWLGGNDRATEGDWTWVEGPEAGTVFYITGVGTQTYSFWSGGEPNNCCGGENDLVFGWGGGGSWNDIGTPAFPDYRVGFIVEYSAPIPEPQTNALLLAGLAGIGSLARRRQR